MNPLAVSLAAVAALAGGATGAAFMVNPSTPPAEAAAVAAYQAGVRTRDGLVTAVAVCLAESGCRNGRVSPPNWDGSRDRGAWQINDVHSGSYDMGRVQDDLAANAQAMYGISGGGANWCPWSTYDPCPGQPYNNSAYRSHLAEAEQVVDRLAGGSARTPAAVSGPEYDGMQPDFAERLAAFRSAAPAAVGVTSGYRDPALQGQLWQAALAKYGTVDAARQWVAPSDGTTCNSNHCRGIAADLSFADTATEQWAHDNAARFGLVFPMSWESWHVELDPNVKPLEPAATATTAAPHGPPRFGDVVDHVWSHVVDGAHQLCETLRDPSTPRLGGLCDDANRVSSWVMGE